VSAASTAIVASTVMVVVAISTSVMAPAAEPGLRMTILIAGEG